MDTNAYSQPQRQPTRRRPKKNSNRTLLLIGGGAAALVVALTVLAFSLLILLTLLPHRIPTGIAVAGVPVGDETIQDAIVALERQLPAQTLTLTDGARSWTVPTADLGISIDVDATIRQAQAAAPNTNVTPVYKVDLAAAEKGFIALGDQINIAAVPGKNGRTMDIPVMLDRLRVDVTGEIADGVFELNMIETPAPVAQTGANYSAATTTYVVQPGQELGLIAKDYGVSVQDIMALNDIANPDIIYPGQQLIIPAAGEYIPTPPPAPVNVGKAIVISTEDQRIYAYQDGKMIHTHLVSTGLPGTPTIHGDYSIYVKYFTTDMTGPGYFLPQVPYTMYFYQGYGIHGTYWHNAFGRPMSHGCVNLPTNEAQWFYNFADVGTPVRVM